MPGTANSPTPPHPSILRLRVSIVGSEPLIWRLLEVSDALRLDELHEVIQLAFDWRDQHLHSFTDLDPFQRMRGLPRTGRPPRVWAQPTPFEDLDEDELDERETTLAEVLGADDTLSNATGSDAFSGPLFYEYDFGDGWTHAIELIERIDDPNARPAALIQGKGRGPFEDSGGIAGYAEKLAALADPEHPDHAETVEWVEWTLGPWCVSDPDAVGIDAANAELAARFGSTDAAGDGSVLDALIARMPAAARRDVRGFLARTGAGAPVEIDAETAAAMVAPFSWLVRRAGEPGIRLTQAGYLPPATVEEATIEFDWLRHRYARTFREDQHLSVARLRDDAVLYGLLRKRNGALHSTARGRALAADPVALWHHLAESMVLKARGGAERDVVLLTAVDVATGRYERAAAEVGYDVTGIIYGLEVLGWASADGGRLTDRDVSGPVYDTLETFGSLGVLGERRGLVLLQQEPDAVPAAGRAFARAVLGARG